MKVLICGSRDWFDIAAIRRRLYTLPRGTTIIHGGARGVDRIAGSIADSLGFHVVVYQADWNSYGRVAGYIRNAAMVTYGKPDLVIAFQQDDSTGTQHTIYLSREAGIACFVVSRTSMLFVLRSFNTHP